jgi:hypothetical protein
LISVFAFVFREPIIFSWSAFSFGLIFGSRDKESGHPVASFLSRLPEHHY